MQCPHFTAVHTSPSNAARYQPVYDFDTDGSPFWEIWIEGFWQAMCLRPDAWSVYAQNEDDDLQRALFLIARLVELATNVGTKPMDMDEELEDLAPDLIPSQVEVLHRSRLALHNPSLTLANDNAPKIGRNDPCPCGSGKKYEPVRMFVSVRFSLYAYKSFAV